jgi:hypothetical protein
MKGNALFLLLQRPIMTDIIELRTNEYGRESG